MEFHPLSEAYPLMPESELAHLVQSMIDNGYDANFPIITYKGKILDGRNRWICAERAGKKPITKEFRGSDVTAAEFVELANEHRRHLTAEWLTVARAERRARVASARKEGESIRTIAAHENVSVGTIQNDLETIESELTVQGYTVQPTSGVVNSADGVKRPAKVPPVLCDRCARIGPTKDCPACAEARKSAPKATKKSERVHKSPEQVDGDSDAENKMKAENSAIESFCRRVMELVKEMPESIWLSHHNLREGVRRKFEDGCGMLRTCKLVAECPACKGEGCKYCLKTGFVPKAILQQLS